MLRRRLLPPLVWLVRALIGRHLWLPNSGKMKEREVAGQRSRRAHDYITLWSSKSPCRHHIGVGGADLWSLHFLDYFRLVCSEKSFCQRLPRLVVHPRRDQADLIRALQHREHGIGQAVKCCAKGTCRPSQDRWGSIYCADGPTRGCAPRCGRIKVCVDGS